MSRRDAGAAGSSARHAKARLQATLGSPPGLLQAGAGERDFVYKGAVEPGTGHHTGADSADAARAGDAGQGPAMRWRLGVRAAVVLGIAAVLAAALFWWQAASGRPEILPLGGLGQGSSAAAAQDDDGQDGAGQDGAGQDGQDGDPEPGEPVGTDAAGDPAGFVVVHVAGAVTAPGVVRLPAGSRVNEAVSAAGGATADADVNRLNLAQVVQDAQKIHVPRLGEAGSPEVADGGEAGAGGGAGVDPPGTRINLNTADVAELDALPKVGPVLAQRIVDWRRDHGAFKSVEELDAVDGVGPKMLEALLPLVTV